MEQKQKQVEEFALASVSELSSSLTSLFPQSSSIVARFTGGCEAAELRFQQDSVSADGYNVDLTSAAVSVWRFRCYVYGVGCSHC